jgi:hypothetical protein
MKTQQPDLSNGPHKTGYIEGLLQSYHKYIKVRETPDGAAYEVRDPKPTFWDKAVQFLSGFRWWGVSARKAVHIISKHTGRPSECIVLYSVEQKRWYLYNCWGDEPCWYASVERDDDWCLLCGTWVVAVSKKSGKVLFSGTASDEG